jgi:hypothetical protein
MNLNRAISKAVLHIRRFFSGYEAAGVSGRWPRSSTMTAPLAQQINARKTVSERAHFLTENSPYVRAIVGNMITAFVGDGPSLQHPNAQIVKAWNERFWSYCDAEGVSDLGHLIARMMRSTIITGDAFILLRVNEFSGSLELLLIPTEQVDHSRNLDRLPPHMGDVALCRASRPGRPAKVGRLEDGWHGDEIRAHANTDDYRTGINALPSFGAKSVHSKEKESKAS